MNTVEAGSIEQTQAELSARLDVMEAQLLEIVAFVRQLSDMQTRMKGAGALGALSILRGG